MILQTWVLILILISSDARGGNGITTQEFTTEKACNNAGFMVSGKHSVQYNDIVIRFKCVPK